MTRAEVGIPIVCTLRHEVDPLLLSVQPAGAAAHEASALWDVRTALHSEREAEPIEQHLPSFLEELPGGAAVRGPVRADAPALRPGESDQVKSLLRAGRGDPDPWRPVPRRRPPSPAYLAGVAAAVGACVALPYGEGLLRCLQAAKQGNKKRAGGDESHRQATKGR